MIDDAIYWTGVIVWTCGAVVAVVAMIRFTLNQMWRAKRAIYSWNYFNAAIRHYREIEPYKDGDAQTHRTTNE